LLIGSITYTPIRILHNSLSLQELTALYAAADVCIVASTTDGLNLVSMEYVAAQRDHHGSLLLSKYAGIAKRLPGSLIFNPWNLYELAELIFTAINLDAEQRELNYKRMEEGVGKYSR
jgi:trehalose-6-phosphate synthase